tara:strand:- start:221 stop:460 length:240 start_codon:yes stop_codon:yes gene_type:complete
VIFFAIFFLIKWRINVLDSRFEDISTRETKITSRIVWERKSEAKRNSVTARILRIDKQHEFVVVTYHPHGIAIAPINKN